jgi:predicted nucleotidyltransferase
MSRGRPALMLARHDAACAWPDLCRNGTYLYLFGTLQAMDRRATSAAGVLFSRTQQRLLRALFAGVAPEGMPYAELLRVTSAGAGGIHRELKQFVSAGLVREKQVGGRRFYFANEAHPVYGELRSLAQKLLGIPVMLREALEPCADGIEEAFIYGSIARGSEDAESDIDVMVVGTCDLAELLGSLQSLEPVLRRHVSVRFYDPSEYHELLRSDPFVKKVAAGPRIPLIETQARRKESMPSRKRKP